MERTKGAVASIRELFNKEQKPMTLTDINKQLPQFKPNNISMALAYLHKQRYVTRVQIDSNSMGRKKCFIYTYYNEKQPKVVEIHQD